jgi:hypothetical protein
MGLISPGRLDAAMKDLVAFLCCEAKEKNVGLQATRHPASTASSQGAEIGQMGADLVD